MGMVAICSPNQNFVLERSRQRSSKTEPEQAGTIACHIFASGGCGSQMGTTEWSLVKRSIDKRGVIEYCGTRYQSIYCFDAE
jgi:hypothetical protein